MMEVQIGKLFGKELLNFPLGDQLKIKKFIDHVKINGLHKLEGKNKNSDEVPKNDFDFIKKVKLSQAHRLWHYHIGITSYDTQKPFGQRTSKYVLHYKNELEPGEIKIVDFLPHPPFDLPQAAYLE